ncbi:MAG: hypothetical protein R6U98_00610 [Pirellulaceae bacterium]
MKRIALGLLLCLIPALGFAEVWQTNTVGDMAFFPFDTSSGTTKIASGTTIYSNSACVMLQPVGSSIYYTVDGSTTPAYGTGFLLNEDYFILLTPNEAKKFWFTGDAISGGTVQLQQFDYWPTK